MNTIRFSHLLTAVLLSVTLAACSSSDDTTTTGTTGGTDGGGTTTPTTTETLPIGSVEVTSGATSVSVGGTITIRALVANTGGTPMSGQVVTFTTSAGTLDADATPRSAEDTTDNNGFAEVTLTAGSRVGNANIGASAGGFTGTATIGFIAGPTSTLSIIASPASVGIASQSTLTVTALDVGGNPVNGELVNAVLSTNLSGASLDSGATATDINGRATVIYTAGNTASVTDVVTVDVADNLVTAVTTSIAVTATSSRVRSITVTPGATQINVDDTIAIQALVLDTQNNPFAGQSVAFTTSAGDFNNGDGTTRTTTATTNAEGIAQVSLTASSIIGAAAVTATSSGFLGSTSVSFQAGPVATLAATASPTNVGVAGQSTIRVLAVDANGNPVSGLSVVGAVGTNNSIAARLATSPVVTTDSGVAEFVYTSGGTSGVTDTLNFETSNGTTASVNIGISANLIAIGGLVLDVANDITEVPVGGIATLLRATVTDAQGDPVEGSVVAFSSTLGTLQDITGAPATQATTDANGFADLLLLSSNEAGTASATAGLSGFNSTRTINFLPGPPSLANSSITAVPNSIPADGTSTAVVTVSLRDAFNNAIPDNTELTLNSTQGSIPATIDDDNDPSTPPFANNPQSATGGRAIFTVVAPNGSPGVATLRLSQFSQVTGTMSFGSAGSGNPTNIRVSTGSAQLSVAGVGQADENTSLTITVADESGTPVPNPSVDNIRISFNSSPNGGEFVSANSLNTGASDSTLGDGVVLTSTDNGVANANIQSGTRPGPIELRVEVLDAAGAPLATPLVAVLTPVAVSPGPPHTINITSPVADAINNLGNGIYERKGAALVNDQYGNPVADGSVISLGMIDTIIAAGADGAITSGSATLTSAGGALNGAVLRNGVNRSLETDDLIMLPLVDAPGNKLRFASAAATGATSIDAQTPYTTTATGLQYAAGVSTLGTVVLSVEPGSSPTVPLANGVGLTQNGVAEFVVRYPANVGTIGYGCGLAQNDDRYADAAGIESDRVFLVASAGSSTDNVTALVEGTFCFQPVVGDSLTGLDLRVQPTTVTAAVNDLVVISAFVQDANLIPLPYRQIRARATQNGFATILDDALNPSVGCITGLSGGCNFVIRIDTALTADNLSVLVSVDGSVGIDTIQLSAPAP